MKVFLLSVILFLVLVDKVAKCSKSFTDNVSNDKKEQIEKHHDKDAFVKKRYIYPRTGRLFRADAERDNLIFDSLERTNFMRRGDVAIPHKRYQRDVHASQRRHFLFRSDAEKNKLRTEDFGENAQNDHETKNAHRQNKGFLFMADVHKINKRDTKTDNQINEPNNQTNDVTSYFVGSQISVNKENKDQDKFKYDKENNNKPIKIYKTKIFSSSSEKKDNEDANKVLKTVFSQQTESVNGIQGKKEVPYGLPQPTERRLVTTPYLTAKVEDVPVVKEYTPDDTNSSTDNDDKDLAEGRSRRKLKKFALPFLLALKMKTAILVPLMFGIVTLIAFKGLWAGITALGISAALGLKALINNSSKVLHEIRSPHYYHYAPEYADYWSRRTGDDPYRPYRTTGWR